MNRFLAAGAAVCALAVLPAQASASWLAPASLGASAFVLDYPDVSVGADGTVATVWYAGGGVQWAVDKPGSALATGTLAATGSAPHVGVDADGDAVAVWTNGSGALVAASRPAGGAWTSPVTLSAAGSFISASDVAVDADGDAVAVWRVSMPTVAVTSATLSGGSWSTPATVDTGAPLSAPSVALDADGDATAIWTNSQSGGWYPTTARRPKGGAWSAPVTIVSTYADTPVIGVDADGDATAAWIDHTSGQIQAATQPASGGAWTAPDVLSALTSTQPALGVDADGNALLAWKMAAGIVASTRSGGGSWSTTQTFGTGLSGTPRVAMLSGGRAILGWTTTNQLASVVNISTSGGSSIPETLGTGTQALSLQLAANEDGEGYAFFVNATSSPLAPLGARLDAAGPKLSGLSIPPNGLAGTQVAFDVTAVDRISAMGTIMWDFGDGATASGAHVTHTYAAAGTYPVEVTATDALGNPSTKSGTIVVGIPSTDTDPGDDDGDNDNGGDTTTTTPPPVPPVAPVPPATPTPPTTALVGLLPTAPARGLAITPTQPLTLGCRLTTGTLKKCVIDVFATPRTGAGSSRVHGMRVAQAVITPATATSAATVKVRLGATGRRMLKRHRNGLLLTVRSRATSATGANLRATDALRVRLKR